MCFFSVLKIVWLDLWHSGARESTGSRVIDLDVDIGAEAVDYKYVFSSVSSLPVPSFS